MVQNEFINFDLGFLSSMFVILVKCFGLLALATPVRTALVEHPDRDPSGLFAVYK